MLPNGASGLQKSRKGSPKARRQEIFPRLPSGVAECGKHKQRKVGGLEAPQSSLEASKSRLEAPKSRPGGFKIEAWGFPNQPKSPPRRHFEKRVNLKSLPPPFLTLILIVLEPTWLQVGGPRPSKMEAETRKNRCSKTMHL